MEQEIDYEKVIEQLQTENEQLREKLADIRLQGYYKLQDFVEDTKKALIGLNFRSFMIGYFVALGVVYILSAIQGGD